MSYGYPPHYGGQGYQGSPQYAPPPNHLVWAILTTLFCCLPAGIVAIVYSAQVDSRYTAGDYNGAVDASNKAKMWSVISAVTLLVLVMLYLILAFIGALAFVENGP